MPSKTSTRKKTSTAKNSGKKSTTRQKNSGKKTPPKKPKNAEVQFREKATGVSFLLLGIVLLVFAFQAPITGTVGPAVKSAFMGTFGSFGYILPIVFIALGIALIVKKEIGIRWGQVILWFVFFLCTMLLFHIFFLREIFGVEKMTKVDLTAVFFNDYVKSSYGYGAAYKGASGALGGMLSFWLLKSFGIFGVIFVPLSYILIVLITKNTDAIRQFFSDTKVRMDERIQEKESQLTPLEQMGTQPTKPPAHRRRMPNAKASKDSDKSSEQTLHIMKEKKQGLYVAGVTAGSDLDYSDPAGSKYTVDENQWNYALDQEHKPSSAGKHLKDDDKPTIQINIADKDDYTTKQASTQTPDSDEYKFPSLDLIAFSNNTLDENLRTECHLNARRLEQTLSSFRIDAKVINITCGPTVTRYEMRPAPGIRVAKINGLSKDLAMALAAKSIRIEAPIPNKNAVGIEIPNRTRSLVGLRDILEGSKFKSAKSHLTICVGKDITGRNIVADLAKMPHMLVAGATGSGKSVFINSLILSLIYKSAPKDVRFIMVDPKKVELNIYNGIPHLLIPVVTKASLAASALNWAVKEMEKRYDLFASKGVRNLDAYNTLAKKKNNKLETLPRIVIIVDELSDLMQVASAEVENAIFRLAQLARAAGMHLVIATQRPDVKVITGTIKANIPCRVAFSVNQLVDSRTIIDSSGAEHLLGNGDMLFKFGDKPIRLQGAFVADREVEKVCKFLKAEGVTYDNNVIADVKKIDNQSHKSADSPGNEFDSLLPDAIKVIYDNEKASTSMVQRKLRVGYNRAARIVDDLERVGVLGPPEGSKPREILVTYGTAMQIVSGDENE